MPNRSMRREEAEALEVVLSHSNLEAVFLDWIDRGEPDYHFWPYLRTCLHYLQEIKKDTPLAEPKVIEKQVKMSPWDSEVIYAKDKT